MSTTTSTSSATHVTWLWLTAADYNGHRVTIETTTHTQDDMAALEHCKRYGHDLRVLDHYDVPTGELLCHRCWGACSDPDFDPEEAGYLAWKHWGSGHLSRRHRLRFWLRAIREWRAA